MALEDHSRLMQAYVERAMVDLPALPTVTIRVVKALENEAVNLKDIEEMIVMDAAITTKLLKVVNSAYFGMPKQISSINQAIAILGVYQVRNLVLSLGVFNALSSSSIRTEREQRQFWERSFGTASCAQTIGGLKGQPSKLLELLFVGGLLHDIGLLFLLTQFTTPYIEILKASSANKVPLVAVERAALHVDHAELGGMLADMWNFPDDLKELIVDHENPGSPVVAPTCACLHIADRLVSSLLPDGACGHTPGLHVAYTNWLGLGRREEAKLREGLVVQIEHAKDLMGLLG